LFKHATRRQEEPANECPTEIIFISASYFILGFNAFDGARRFGAFATFFAFGMTELTGTPGPGSTAARRFGNIAICLPPHDSARTKEGQPIRTN
jgi:hypothetical protein